jgi:hypothetical protein
MDDFGSLILDVPIENHPLRSLCSLSGCHPPLVFASIPKAFGFEADTHFLLNIHMK